MITNLITEYDASRKKYRVYLKYDKENSGSDYVFYASQYEINLLKSELSNIGDNIKPSQKEINKRVENRLNALCESDLLQDRRLSSLAITMGDISGKVNKMQRGINKATGD